MEIKERIIAKIEEIFQDDEYGFDVFVTMKTGVAIKRFVLFEGGFADRNNLDINFKKKIQMAIAEEVKNKFIDTEKLYDIAENIADNQNKFYVIKQDEMYNPFAFINTPMTDMENYCDYERDNINGMFFCFKRPGKASVWAYQHLYQNAIPNKKAHSFHIFQQGDVFVEMKKPLLLIGRRVDLLIIGDEIITDNTDLIQKKFGFQKFVKIHAKRVVDTVAGLGLVSNVNKLENYINRNKQTYARKMMRIKDSRVFNKTASELYQSVTTLPRWKGKFDVDEETQKIVLNTYVQVENLIDLLDERYTRSDVTGEEYDTSAKKWVAPIGE